MTGEVLLEEVEDLLALGFDVPDALAAVGRDYSSTLRVARRLKRADLEARLRAWKAEDTARARRARGLAWV